MCTGSAFGAPRGAFTILEEHRHMTRRRPTGTVAALSLTMVALGGCNTLTPTTTCTDELRSSLLVFVVDAPTAASAAVGATVIVRGAAFRDSVLIARESTPPGAAYSASENEAVPGLYDVVVRKPGYLEWRQASVEIRGGRCHVEEPARVTAMLLRGG
jgi:hypothetical protein